MPLLTSVGLGVPRCRSLCISYSSSSVSGSLAVACCISGSLSHSWYFSTCSDLLGSIIQEATVVKKPGSVRPCLAARPCSWRPANPTRDRPVWHEYDVLAENRCRFVDPHVCAMSYRHRYRIVLVVSPEAKQASNTSSRPPPNFEVTLFLLSTKTSDGTRRECSASYATGRP